MKHTEPGASERSASSSLSAHERKAALAREALYQELDRSIDRSLVIAERATRHALPVIWGALVFGALLGTLAVVRLTRRRPSRLALLKVNLTIQPFPERHPVLAAIASAALRQLFQELSARRSRLVRPPALGAGAPLATQLAGESLDVGADGRADGGAMPLPGASVPRIAVRD